MLTEKAPGERIGPKALNPRPQPDARNLERSEPGAEASPGRGSCGSLSASGEPALFLFERFVTIKQITESARRGEAQTGIKCDPKWPLCAKATRGAPAHCPEAWTAPRTRPGLRTRANSSQPGTQACVRRGLPQVPLEPYAGPPVLSSDSAASPAPVAPDEIPCPSLREWPSSWAGDGRVADIGNTTVRRTRTVR